MKYLNIIIWFFYLIFFPFQIYESGNLQIADIFLILGLIINIKILLISLYSNILLYLKIFVIYCLLIATYFSIIYNDFTFFKSPLNYLYCFFSCLLIKHYISNFNFVNVTLVSIFATSLTQTILYFNLDTSEAFRVTLFFNNPNQLAFFGIILNVFLLLFIPYSTLKFRYILFILSFISSSFLIFLSISQTAIVINVLMIIFILFKYIIKHISLFFIFLILLIIFSINSEYANNDYKPLLNVLTRLDNELEEGFDGDNGLEGRNYDRVIKFPQYLIFGAGESRLDRFDKNLNLEIHSVFINILFSYGIIGFLFFILYIQKLVSNLDLNNLLLFLFFILFTLPHNMLRWPLFWILTFIFYHINQIYNETNKILNSKIN